MIDCWFFPCQLSHELLGCVGVLPLKMKPNRKIQISRKPSSALVKSQTGKSPTSYVEVKDSPRETPHRSVMRNPYKPTIFTRHNLHLDALLLENPPWFCSREIGRLMGYGRICRSDREICRYFL